jgi:hypothetical protein
MKVRFTNKKAGYVSNPQPKGWLSPMRSSDVPNPTVSSRSCLNVGQNMVLAHLCWLNFAIICGWPQILSKLKF